MTATADTFDATGVQTITTWVRRGDDSFSEDPDPGEDLVFEVWDRGAWQLLETVPGGPPSGEIFTRFYDVTALVSPAFAVRYRMTAGSGSGWDFYHVDSVCFLATPPPIPNIVVTKVGCEDGTSCVTVVGNGDVVEYTLQVENNGVGPASEVEVVDDLNPFTAFGLDSYGAEVPVSFTDSGSGLLLGTPEYSDDDAATFAHALVSGSAGASSRYDGLVTDFRIPMTGTMPAGTSFEIRFKVELK